MEQSRVSDTDMHVQVRNLGGINESTVHLQTGVNILSGRNATNRTSLLRAIMGALGSDYVSLKADTNKGDVQLVLDGETYTRELNRKDGIVITGGNPYLDDSTLADLFAFLLESNEARLAVSRDEDLRDLIMRPVDVDDIRAAISEAEIEKRQFDDQITELDTLTNELPELEAEKTRLQEQIKTTRNELVNKRNKLDAMEGTVENSREQKQQLESTLDELQSVQSQLEKIRFQRETEHESVETLKGERADLESKIKELPDAPTGERSKLETKLESLRERLSGLDTTATQLQSVIQFNEEMLEGTNTDIAKAIQRTDETESASNSGELTNQLVEDSESIICWTCGSHVETDQIESTIDRLRTLRRDELSERNDFSTKISELTTEQKILKKLNSKKLNYNGVLNALSPN